MYSAKWLYEEDQVLLTSILCQEAGWRDRLATLLGRHHEALLVRCRGYLKNREDAEDATQETELRAFRAIHSFRGDAAFRTWLFAIADRQCHTLAARRLRHMMDWHLRALIEIDECNRHRGVEVDELVDRRVREVLGQLSESARDVLMLRFYRELSLEEVADTLRIGLSATKMRLYRALDQCAARLPGDMRTLIA